jgi:hypothetical protein
MLDFILPTSWTSSLEELWIFNTVVIRMKDLKTKLLWSTLCPGVDSWTRIGILFDWIEEKDQRNKTKFNVCTAESSRRPPLSPLVLRVLFFNPPKSFYREERRLSIFFLKVFLKKFEFFYFKLIFFWCF